MLPILLLGATLKLKRKKGPHNVSYLYYIILRGSLDS